MKTDLITPQSILDLKKRQDQLWNAAQNVTDSVKKQELYDAYNINHRVLNCVLSYYDQKGLIGQIDQHMRLKKDEAEGNTLFKIYSPAHYKIMNCYVFRFIEDKQCGLKYVAVFGTPDNIEAVVHVDDLLELNLQPEVI